MKREAKATENIYTYTVHTYAYTHAHTNQNKHSKRTVETQFGCVMSLIPAFGFFSLGPFLFLLFPLPRSLAQHSLFYKNCRNAKFQRKSSFETKTPNKSTYDLA